TFSGCSKASIPETGIVRLKLLVLRPMMAQSFVELRGSFHNFPVVSTSEVDPSKAPEAVKAVTGDLIPFVQKACIFSPRHGLSIEYANRTIDVLICYQCGDVVIFEGSSNGRWVSLAGTDPNFGTRSKQLLDGLLAQAPPANHSLVRPAAR
ncbi:MAG: hypothetical protein AB1457_18475, partial [Chloroflexota bacterium]